MTLIVVNLILAVALIVAIKRRFRAIERRERADRMKRSILEQ